MRAAPAVCRACLRGAGAGHLRAVRGARLRQLYERLSGAQWNAGDGRPSTMCSVCYVQLQRCRWFSDMVEQADQFLKQLLLDDMQVTSETVGSLNMGILQNLSLSTIKSTSFVGDSIDGSSLVKQETKDTLKMENCSSTYQVEIHNDTKKEDVDTVDMQYHYCPECDKTSKTKQELMAHLRAHGAACARRHLAARSHKIIQR